RAAPPTRTSPSTSAISRNGGKRMRSLPSSLCAVLARRRLAASITRRDSTREIAVVARRYGRCAAAWRLRFVLDPAANIAAPLGPRYPPPQKAVVLQAAQHWSDPPPPPRPPPAPRRSRRDAERQGAGRALRPLGLCGAGETGDRRDRPQAGR